MTAPAEYPRGGGGRCDCRACSYGHPMECEYEAERSVRAALRAAGRGDTDSGGEALPDAVLVEGDWVSPSYEAHARDLTKSWADAAQNAGCPAAFVARMRSFADVHDRNYRVALTAGPAGDRAQPTQELREAIRDEIAGWSLGSGYYQYTVTTDDAGELADALIAGPLAALLDAQAAVGRVADELLSDAESAITSGYYRDAADRLRAALDGTT